MDEFPAPLLGLRAAHTVQSAATAAGCAEVAFSVASREAVHALHAAWGARGLTMVQAPTYMDFGHTFVPLDPDNHRLRVFAPTPAKP